MSNTLEHLIVDVIGVAERGVESDGPFVRANGTGWVRATTKHQYADAQARNNPVTLLACESTGALSSTFYNALVALDKESRLKTTHDSTIYGTARSSPRTFSPTTSLPTRVLSLPLMPLPCTPMPSPSPSDSLLA